jgi:hypothetical protein
MAIGAKDFADGQASMIDAVNRHNDAAACKTAIAKKETQR